MDVIGQDSLLATSTTAHEPASRSKAHTTTPALRPFVYGCMPSTACGDACRACRSA